MEKVNGKISVLEELGLAKHAVRPQRASKIVNDPLGRLRPSRHKSRKYVISALALRYTVKTIAYAMRAPYDHDSAREPMFSILGVVLSTHVAAGFADVFFLVGLEIRIDWSVSNPG